MDSPFYDITLPYDYNWEQGPPLAKQNITPPKRTITKKYKFLGFNVNMPFGIAAGALLNSQYIKAAFAWGFDVNCYKTQRSTAFPVNPFPNILYVDIDGDLTLERAKKPLVGSFTTTRKPTKISITNSLANPSRGPQVWQEDMKRALTYQGDGQLLIASVVGTIQEGFSEEDYFSDFAKTASLAHQTGVKVIELNLACPNVASEGVICYTRHAVKKICRLSKEKIGNTPLIAKLGYYSKEQKELLENIVKDILPFVDAISAINTIPSPVVDKHGNQALPGKGRLRSGICGACVKWAGIDMVKQLMRLRNKLHANYAIVGVGGVMTPQDYQDYRNAGADLVQSVTGAMWNPYLAYEVWERENT